MNFSPRMIPALTAGVFLALVGLAGMLAILGYVPLIGGMAMVLAGVGSWLLALSIAVMRAGRRSFEAPPLYYAIWGTAFLGAAFIALNIGVPATAAAVIFAVVMLIGMIVIANVLFGKERK